MEPLSFFGPVIPPEVRRGLPLIVKLQQTEFRALLQTSVKYLKEGDSLPKIQQNQEEKQKDLLQLILQTQEEENRQCCIVALFYIVRGLIRSRYITSSNTQKEKEKLKEAILEIPGLPEPFQKDLFQICVVLSSSELEEKILAQKPHFPTLKQIRWRVDVSISNDAMSRLMKPSILLEMTLENGSIKVFEISVQKFQELRYQVARVLKDMYDLERNPILKIDT